MIRFDTDELAPQERFDHWREVRGRSLFGVTIELPAERRPAFSGFFRAHAVGGAIASEMRASAYHVSRTEADIGRVAGDSLCIALQVKGGGLLRSGRDHSDRVREGDLVVTHSDLPHQGVPGDHEQFHCLMLKIPLDDTLTLGQPAHDLFATRYLERPAFARPFRALFTALVAEGSSPADPAGEITGLARLALAARGRLALAMPEVRAALRVGLYYAALEILHRDKRKWEVTPMAVATELGISLRQLHLVFEAAQQSFARTLAAFRLADARALLLRHPALPVTDIAYACGFESLATFYRLFGGQYGLAPGELRRQASLH
jgi:AraC-like DNA-binding protein